MVLRHAAGNAVGRAGDHADLAVKDASAIQVDKFEAKMAEQAARQAHDQLQTELKKCVRGEMVAQDEKRRELLTRMQMLQKDLSVQRRARVLVKSRKNSGIDE